MRVACALSLALALVAVVAPALASADVDNAGARELRRQCVITCLGRGCDNNGVCLGCPAGFQPAGPQGKLCLPCPRGFYKSATDLSQCMACDSLCRANSCRKKTGRCRCPSDTGINALLGTGSEDQDDDASQPDNRRRALPVAAGPTNCHPAPACGALVIDSANLPVVGSSYATPSGFNITVSTVGTRTSGQMVVTIAAPVDSTFTLTAGSITAGDNSAQINTIYNTTTTGSMGLIGYDATGTMMAAMIVPNTDSLQTTPFFVQDLPGNTGTTMPFPGLSSLVLSEHGNVRKGFAYSLTFEIDPCLYGQ